MKTHLEVQQREDTRRDLVARKKFVPPDLRVGEGGFYWQEESSKIQQERKSGKWLLVEILAVKGPMAAISTGASVLQVTVSKLRRPLDTVDLEQPPHSNARTRAPVQWLTCKGQVHVWELFSDNS